MTWAHRPAVPLPQVHDGRSLRLCRSQQPNLKLSQSSSDDLFLHNTACVGSDM